MPRAGETVSRKPVMSVVLRYATNRERRNLQQSAALIQWMTIIGHGKNYPICYVGEKTSSSWLR